MSWTPKLKKIGRNIVIVLFSEFQFVRRWHGGVWELRYVAGLEVDNPIWFPRPSGPWEVTGSKPSAACIGTPLKIEVW
jgi:hypothetical protein